MAADLTKYDNTYDINAKKWVRDMTDSELETYGYKEKTPADPEETSVVATKARAKKASTTA